MFLFHDGYGIIGGTGQNGLRPERNAGLILHRERYMAKNQSDASRGKALAALCLVLALLGAGGFCAARIVKDMETVQTDSVPIPAQFTTTAVTTEPPDPHALDCTEQQMFVSDIKSGNLVLVNNTHPTVDLTKDKLVSVYETRGAHVHVKDINVMLQPEAAEAFNALADGFFRATGKEDLMVMNGYRTKDDQARISKQNPGTAAPAGCSDYETGLALELRLLRNGKYADFDGTGEYQWVLDHAAQYGFVVRFPEGKQAQTGYDYAPAHLRYVGIPHASFMASHEMCLEEYLDELNDHLYGTLNLPVAGADGASYIVYRYRPDDRSEATVSVPVPKNVPYTVSGDHIDSYIIAAKTETGTVSHAAEAAAPEDAQNAVSATTAAPIQ